MSKAIEVYSPDVRQGIEQYKAGLAIKDATDQEYASLWILCQRHDLDAYNQEAYIIPGKGVMVGIKGLRKSANRQLAKGEYYNPSPRLLQHTEYAAFGLDEAVPPKGQTWEGNQKVWKDNPIVLVYICELTRSDANQKWINQAVALTGLTGDHEQALKLIGPRPVWTGVGVVRLLDKSKMEMVQLARKRAEADATKLAFNLPFNVDVERGGDELAQPGDVIDGDVVQGKANYPEVTVSSVWIEPDSEPVATETASIDGLYEDKRLCDMTGPELGFLRKSLMAQLQEQDPKFVERHFDNRFKKRFQVQHLNEIQVDLSQFVEIMMQPSEAKS